MGIQQQNSHQRGPNDLPQKGQLTSQKLDPHLHNANQGPTSDLQCQMALIWVTPSQTNGATVHLGPCEKAQMKLDDLVVRYQ
jgi:hypothetical protein